MDGLIRSRRDEHTVYARVDVTRFSHRDRRFELLRVQKGAGFLCIAAAQGPITI